MDDSGGTWYFMGYQDEVLVEWSVYDGSTNQFDTGVSTYTKIDHLKEIVRDLAAPDCMDHGQEALTGESHKVDGDSAPARGLTYLRAAPDTKHKSHSRSK